MAAFLVGRDDGADQVTARAHQLHLQASEPVSAAGTDRDGAAFRGAGANFGVVTSFTFRLHEVGPTVYGGLIAVARQADLLLTS